MEEEKSPSPEDITQFNNGYLLKEFEPELLDVLLSSIQGGNESLVAFKAGITQNINDNFNQRTLSWLDRSTHNEPGNEVEKDKSIEDIEPEL